MREAFERNGDKNMDSTSILSYAAVDMADMLDVKAIVASSISGHTARKISGFRPEILVKKKSFGPYSVNIDLKGVLSIYDYFLEQDIFKTPLNEKAVSPFNLVVTNEGKLNLVDAKNTILWTQ